MLADNLDQLNRKFRICRTGRRCSRANCGSPFRALLVFANRPPSVVRCNPRALILARPSVCFERGRRAATADRVARHANISAHSTQDRPQRIVLSRFMNSFALTLAVRGQAIGRAFARLRTVATTSCPPVTPWWRMDAFGPAGATFQFSISKAEAHDARRIPAS